MNVLPVKFAYALNNWVSSPYLSFCPCLVANESASVALFADVNVMFMDVDSIIVHKSYFVR